MLKLSTLGKVSFKAAHFAMLCALCTEFAGRKVQYTSAQHCSLLAAAYSVEYYCRHVYLSQLIACPRMCAYGTVSCGSLQDNRGISKHIMCCTSHAHKPALLCGSNFSTTHVHCMTALYNDCPESYHQATSHSWPFMYF